MNPFGIIALPNDMFPSERATEELRVMLCLPVAHSPLPPASGSSYDECCMCGQQVWVGAQQRQLISEFEALDYGYQVRCCCCNSGIEDTDWTLIGAGNEASRLALLRGARPRQDFTVVSMADVPAILAANPGFNPLFRY